MPYKELCSPGKPWFDIAWLGSESHLFEVKKALPTIKRFCDSKADARFFCTDIWGPGKNLSSSPKKTEFMSWAGFPDFINCLIANNWDIYLSLLQKSEFNRSKSNIKWIEATINGSALLTAATEPFSEVTTDMGLTYESLEDLYAKLEYAYINRDRRQEWVNNSLEYLHQHYDPAKESPRLYRWLEEHN